MTQHDNWKFTLTCNGEQVVMMNLIIGFAFHFMVCLCVSLCVSMCVPVPVSLYRILCII